jgi:hypothetical protein
MIREEEMIVPKCQDYGKTTLFYPCYAEVKLDGEFNMYRNGTLTNRSGKVREWNCLPNVPPDVTLLGELHYGEGKWGQLYDLLSRENKDDLHFTAFDIVNGMLPYAARRTELLRLNIPTSTSYYCHNEESAENAFNNAVADGYEGVVYKVPFTLLINGGWVKRKKKETADLEVIGVDPTSERIEVRVNDSTTGGVKCPYRYKRSISVGDIVEVEHQGMLTGGGMRHAVFVRKRSDKKEADSLCA